MLNIIWLACFYVASTIFEAAIPQEPEVIVPFTSVETTAPSPKTMTLPESEAVVSPAAERKVVHRPGGIYQTENEDTILTWWDYAHTYEGLCPHEQPEGPFKASTQWITAIGSQYDDSTVPEGYLEQIWGQWHRGYVKGVQEALLNDGTRFTVDWDNLIVVDNSDLTSFLQGLEKRYQAHCPND